MTPWLLSRPSVLQAEQVSTWAGLVSGAVPESKRAGLVSPKQIFFFWPQGMGLVPGSRVAERRGSLSKVEPPQQLTGSLQMSNCGSAGKKNVFLFSLRQNICLPPLHFFLVRYTTHRLKRHDTNAQLAKNYQWITRLRRGMLAPVPESIED